MYKILFLFSFLTLSILAQAQTPCVPGTLTKPGKGYIIPDSASGIMHACPGQAYEQIIYMKVPKDTSFLGFTANIDSFVISTLVTGLPSYISISSVPGIKAAVPTNPKLNYPHITVKGDSLACIKLSGNVPAGTATSSTQLVIPIRGYISSPLGISLDTTFNLTNYSFVVESGSSTYCLSATREAVLENNMFDVYPNPFFKDFTLKFKGNALKPSVINIFNSLGQKIYSQDWDIKNGFNSLSINMSEYPEGQYILNLVNEDGLFSKKITLLK